MRRTVSGGLVSVLAALAVLAGPVTAGAQADPPAPELTGTSWVQPSADLLDGVGTWLYLQPPAGPALATDGYEYALEFVFSGSQRIGAVGLGTDQNGRFAGLATGGGPTQKLRFGWQTGRLYFVLAYRVGTDLWGGWVYDNTAGAWSFIGQTTAVAGSGNLAPGMFTVVDWDAAALASCDQYGRTDAWFAPPVGLRGSGATVATKLGDAPSTGTGCPTQATTELGWAHYRLGGDPPA